MPVARFGVLEDAALAPAVHDRQAFECGAPALDEYPTVIERERIRVRPARVVGILENLAQSLPDHCAWLKIRLRIRNRERSEPVE